MTFGMTLLSRAVVELWDAIDFTPLDIPIGYHRIDNEETTGTYAIFKLSETKREYLSGGDLITVMIIIIITGDQDLDYEDIQASVEAGMTLAKLQIWDVDAINMRRAGAEVRLDKSVRDNKDVGVLEMLWECLFKQ